MRANGVLIIKASFAILKASVVVRNASHCWRIFSAVAIYIFSMVKTEF